MASRSSTLIGAALIAAGLAVSTPVHAAPHFQADPVAAPAENKIVARDTVWTCGAAGCSADKSHSRPAIVCAVLAKQVGTLRSFAVAGEPLPADELEKCNARAER